MDTQPKRSTNLCISLTQGERAQVQAIAAAHERSVSGAVRLLVRREAERLQLTPGKERADAQRPS